MYKLLCLAALAALIASGCSSPAADQTPEVKLGDGTSVELAEPDNTATRGSISGVLVDEAIRPIAGAAIDLVGLGPTSTDDAGLFVFVDLQPGLYTLKVMGGNYSGIRYRDAEVATEVRAGETAHVRVFMIRDLTPFPYHADTLKFDGFMEVDNGLVNFALGLTGSPPPGWCTCNWTFTAEGPVSTIVSELSYNPTTTANPAPLGSWVVFMTGDNGGATGIGCGTNPCIYHSEYDSFFDNETRDFTLTVSSDPYWVSINQAFQVYITLFYVDPAPGGWSFIKGDR